MNTTKSLHLLAFSFLFMLIMNVSTVCSQSVSSEELKETINDNYKQFTQFIKNNEPGELAETLYTEDAKFYPPNGGMVEGTMGVTKAFEGLIGVGLVIEPEAQEVEIFGDHAYEYGIGTVKNKSGEKIRKERYVCVWKNVEGTWKIYRDLVQGVAIE